MTITEIYQTIDPAYQPELVITFGVTLSIWHSESVQNSRYTVEADEPEYDFPEETRKYLVSLPLDAADIEEYHHFDGMHSEISRNKAITNWMAPRIYDYFNENEEIYHLTDDDIMGISVEDVIVFDEDIYVSPFRTAE